MAWAPIERMPRADKTSRDLDKALLAIFLEAAGALIDQLGSAGITDPADIARRLNRRGLLRATLERRRGRHGAAPPGPSARGRLS